MAEILKTLWTSYDPDSDETATITYTYDNVSLTILFFTVNNPTAKVITFSATSTSSGKNYSGQIPAGTNTTITMTPGASNRLNISILSNGRIDGVEYHIEFG